MSNQPGASNRVINDLVPGVIDALQQRTDVASIIPKYVKRALQELTETNTFEELRRTGPLVQLTTGVAVYPVSQFLLTGDDYTSMEALIIFVDPPQNSVEYALKFMGPNAIEMMMGPATKGMPSRYTRYATNLHIGPVPDKAYTMFARYQRRHPFPDDVGALGGASVLIPDSWEEIVEYAAAYRIAIVKRWNDQADTLHKILWGDPAAGQGIDGLAARPGLIAARKFQFERDSRFNSRQLGIMTQRYGVR
jgi:hypothetical protein